MRTLFADTFYFLALLNRNDRAHGKALFYSRVPQLRLVTTEYVLLELGDALHKPPLREEFAAVYDLVHHASAFQIITGHKSLLQRGLKLYKARRDKEWQLTDCISFVVMNETGLTHALTGDRHFEQAGFTALLK